MKDFLFHEPLEQLDPALAELIAHEAERQERKLVMVPSESLQPAAVHEAVGSVFSHLYAEGYPHERTRRWSEEKILDYELELGRFRRYSDPRYYKGVEYADVLEALARRRTAEVFGNGIPAERLYVNVQSLSGAPANTAVQHALLEPGDTILSLSLYVGGHLSHGSKVAYSGQTYNVVHYTVDTETERLDFEQIRSLALENKPKLIIAGFTSYPRRIEWQKFRAIADEVGAYLLADIAHIAGLVAAGVMENPVGIADVVTFTTHKTMDGPRGAVIITDQNKLRRKIDRAVFPGLQGGPHLEAIAGIAAAMQLAKTEKFQALQAQTVANARALAAALEAEGLRVPYGGTDSHMILIDCRTIKSPDGTPLMGDVAANLLDLVGIVANRNTIPGDTTAAYPSGVRLGTPWITQRGLKEPEMKRIAHAIAQLLKNAQPFTTTWRRRKGYLARVDFDILEAVKADIATLTAEFSSYTEDEKSGYPHFYFLSDELRGNGAYERLELVGTELKSFVEWLTPSDTANLAAQETRPLTLLTANGEILAPGLLTWIDKTSCYLDVPTEKAAHVLTWLRQLTDAYVATDDLYGKLPFLSAVRDLGTAPTPTAELVPETGPFSKPYFIGAHSRLEPAGDPLPKFEWKAPEDAPLRKTHLNDVHRELGGRMVPFGGWDMPVWYSSNLQEHQAVREAAGLFDVSHMGCWEITGPEASSFLNLLLVNDLDTLKVGKSQYTAFFDVDGIPLDDLLVYRLAEEQYLLVVNAANNDKDWAWVNAVLNGEVLIDPERPWASWAGKEGVQLRDLRAAEAGEDMRAELALQGQASRKILLALGGSEEDLAAIKKLRWTGITQVTLGGFDLIVSRTGYTGERVAYELFVHPTKLVDFWQTLLTVGKPFGIQPCGLAARDSLRMEAGLPLYGHEMAGPLNLTMGDAGFGSYAKTYKPFFIGRKAFLQHETQRKAKVIRFGIAERGPMPQQGDPVVSARGKVIGRVTSAAIDMEGNQLGQAYVKQRYQKRGTQLSVLVTPRRQPKSQAELEIGDRTSLPITIEVLRRFPRL